MYTKTVILDEAISLLERQQDLSVHLLKAMRNHALLLLTPADLARLETSLSWRAFQVLKEGMVKRHFPHRTWSGDIAAPNDLTPEVFVSDHTVPGKYPPFTTDINEYDESEPVTMRADFRSQRYVAKDREEFWVLGPRPLIDSFAPEGRTIDLIDQYVFQDFRRHYRRSQSNKNSPSMADIGLVWLLQKLDAEDLNSIRPLKVRIVTSEGDRNDPLTIDEMSELLTEVTKHAKCSQLELKIVVVPVSQHRDAAVGRGFKRRLLVVNQKSAIVLAKGAGDFTREFDPKSKTTRVIARESWSWIENFNADEVRAMSELLKKIPESHKLRPS